MGSGYFEPLIPGTQRQASLQGGLSFCRPCLASSGSLAYGRERWRTGASITFASSDWAFSFYARCAIGRLYLIDHPQNLARQAFHLPGP